jgi:hypothetical protein
LGFDHEPVSAMNASMSPGRYWMHFSRVRKIAILPVHGLAPRLVDLTSSGRSS